MFMFFHLNTRQYPTNNGSALVIALVVLAIIGALGVASLDVADMNILISANDRDSKDSFFHADSGTNIGHEYLEDAIEDVNSTFYNSNASGWQAQSAQQFNATEYPVSFYIHDTQGSYIRSGILDRGAMDGSALQIAAGYEGTGKSASHGGSYTTVLIRSHRQGLRNSMTEVDIAWRHIN